MTKRVIYSPSVCPRCVGPHFYTTRMPGGPKADILLSCKECSFTVLYHIKAQTVELAEAEFESMCNTLETLRLYSGKEDSKLMALQKTVATVNSDNIRLAAANSRLEGELLAERLSRTQKGIDLTGGKR